MIEIPRRKFITGLASLIAAPALVRASSLMPVKNFNKNVIVEYWNDRVFYFSTPSVSDYFWQLMINSNKEMMDVTGIYNLNDKC